MWIDNDDDNNFQSYFKCGIDPAATAMTDSLHYDWLMTITTWWLINLLTEKQIK